ncbi:MAG TPA: hypothetical protein VK254_01785 [Candidatus Bathyarchaeia archaeon]|nr:hypothetical protein [Candidatus Bathyarchaeia archaeon]
MSNQKNSDKRCCENPDLEKVTDDLHGFELGTTCRNCGRTKSGSAKK